MSQDDNSMGFIAVIGLAMVAVGYVWWTERGGEQEIMGMVNGFLAIPWLQIGLVAGGIIGAALLFRMANASFKEKKEQELTLQRKKEEQKRKLTELLNSNFSDLSSYGIQVKLEKIQNEYESFYHYEEKKTQKEMDAFYSNIKRKITEQAEKEAGAEQYRQEQEEAQRREQERLVEELFAFKKKHRSATVLPLDKTYPPLVINEAVWKMRKYQEEQHWRKEKRQEAITFYQSNDLSTKPHLTDKREEKIYAEIRKEIQDGKLNLQKVTAAYQSEPLPKQFYRTGDLSEAEKQQAKAQGFAFVRQPELDGSVRGGFYIKKKNPRETEYHFVTKHLFAELHEDIEVEKTIGDKRADAVFHGEDFLLGIEIETGANREEYLAAKIQWLNDNFGQWIFVCPKKLHAQYQKYVDGKKSYCLTAKEALQFVKELLPENVSEGSSRTA